LSFVSPDVADILFYETVDTQRIGADVPEYGSPHPDSIKWPHHELVFVQQDSQEGQLYKFYYAARRENQDEYNYELKEGLAVDRTYVIPRGDYPSKLPVPVGGSPDSVYTGYGFVSDTLMEVEEPLKGIYVAIQRRFEPIVRTEIQYDSVLETNGLVTYTLKPFGFTLSSLSSSSSSSSSGSANNSIYEVKYANQYHSVLVTSAAGLGHPLQRKQVLNYVSPDVRDILFYQTYPVSAFPAGQPVYGSAHPDAGRWPNHELVFVQSDDGSNGHLYRFYYASRRASQNAYNYELKDGSELVRTYVIKRADYPSQLPVPAGGTLDSVFTDYGFVGDSIRSVDEYLSSVYIAVQRRYIIPEVTETVYDPNIEANVKTVKTVVSSRYDLVANNKISGAGETFEVRHGNKFHDILIRQTVKNDAGQVPDRTLDTIYSAQKYDAIPQRLDSVLFAYVSSFVSGTDTTGNARGQYAEDNTAEFAVTAPSSGPFKTKTERTVTASPEGLINSILASANFLPRPKREDVSIKYAAYSFNPPTAQAAARQYTLPTAIHGVVPVTSTGTVNGTTVTPTGLTIDRSTTPSSLAATPGFNGTDLVGNYLIDVNIRRTSLDLFIVEATSLILNGVYPTAPASSASSASASSISSTSSRSSSSSSSSSRSSSSSSSSSSSGSYFNYA
jgi:hypothetical protein